MAGTERIDATALSDAELTTDRVFRALGEYNRRELVRLIHDRPGVTLTELTAAFVISRFAVMKHLNILESAGIIRREAVGTSKRHYYCHQPVKGTVLPWLAQLEGKDDDSGDN